MNFNKSQMKIFIEGIEYDLVPKSSPDKKSECDWRIIDWDSSSVTKYSLLRGTCGDLSPNGMIGRGYKIKSVKRLSDGVVFSVGDSVDIKIGSFNKGMGGDGWKRFTSEITKFNIYHNEIFIECGSCSGSLKEAISLKEYACKLPERTKLFRTINGEDVFIGDVYWYVDSRFKLYSIKACSTQDIGKGDIQFISEEKAKEYITLNKPCLSVNDVCSLYSLVPSKESLINLAKSKL